MDIKPIVIVGINPENGELVVKAPQGEEHKMMVISCLCDAIKIVSIPKENVEEKSSIITPQHSEGLVVAG